MLGCNSSCSAAIVCIFKCLDWLGKRKFLNKSINEGIIVILILSIASDYFLQINPENPNCPV